MPKPWARTTTGRSVPEAGADTRTCKSSPRSGAGRATGLMDLVAAVYRHQVEACAEAVPALLETATSPSDALRRWVDRFPGDQAWPRRRSAQRPRRLHRSARPVPGSPRTSIGQHPRHRPQRRRIPRLPADARDRRHLRGRGNGRFELRCAPVHSTAARRLPPVGSLQRASISVFWPPVVRCTSSRPGASQRGLDRGSAPRIVRERRRPEGSRGNVAVDLWWVAVRAGNLRGDELGGEGLGRHRWHSNPRTTRRPVTAESSTQTWAGSMGVRRSAGSGRRIELGEIGCDSLWFIDTAWACEPRSGIECDQSTLT